MREIRTAVDVDVDPATAWAVLTDLDRVGTWNPFLRSIEGEPVIGARLRVRLEPPGRKPMTFRPVVTEAVPGASFEWLGRVGVRGLFDGRHRFELEPLPDGRTRLHHSERFTGVLVPLLWPTMAGPTTDGFEAANAAFAARCREAARHGASTLD